MRILSFIPILAAAITAVMGAALPYDDGCGLSGPCKRGSPVYDARDLTNAERLRRGLPLKSPILRRHGTPVHHSDPSGRPDPDHNHKGNHGNKHDTISHRGVIQVLDASTSAVLGYVSKTTKDKSQFLYKSDVGSALVVTFDTDKTGSGTNLNLATRNSDAGFDLLGLVQGLTNTDSVLSSGSSEFAVLATIASPGTTPGSGPQQLDNSYASANKTKRSAESAIWNFDSDSGTLSLGWVNPDGPLPTVQSFTQSDGTIIVSGDVNAFKDKYPTTTTVIKFKFVSS